MSDLSWPLPRDEKSPRREISPRSLQSPGAEAPEKSKGKKKNAIYTQIRSDPVGAARSDRDCGTKPRVTSPRNLKTVAPRWDRIGSDRIRFWVKTSTPQAPGPSKRSPRIFKGGGVLHRSPLQVPSVFKLGFNCHSLCS